jgi:hypothetical protein
MGRWRNGPPRRENGIVERGDNVFVRGLGNCQFVRHIEPHTDIYITSHLIGRENTFAATTCPTCGHVRFRVAKPSEVNG